MPTKWLDITAILLGALAFAFFFPVVILFTGVIALIIARAGGGNSASVWGFSFAFSLRRAMLFIVFIVCLPILVSWIGRKMSSRRS